MTGGVPVAAADPAGTPVSRDVGAPGSHRQLRLLGRAVVSVLPAWLTARVLVGLALLVAHLGVRSLRPDNPAAVQRVHQGLLSWDAGWYRSIAAHGYAAGGRQSLRFFPLFPMLGRYLGTSPASTSARPWWWWRTWRRCWPWPACSSWCATTSGRRPGPSVGLAAGPGPVGVLMVLAYSDALLLLCSVVTFLGIRTGRWWWAAAAGLAAGAVRPVGVLLVVPVALELWSRGTADAPGRRVAGAAALVAPAGRRRWRSWCGWDGPSATPGCPSPCRSRAATGASSPFP